jgi:predicted transposase YbfD/YdcC
MESSTDCAKEQVCLEQNEPAIRSLYERLQRVPDRRKQRGKRYEAAVVLTLLVLAKLAGETKMSGIAQWARLRAEWLSQVLSLHEGQTPCANTYQYVCDHVDKSALDAEIEAFTAENAAKTVVEPAGGPRRWRQLAIDGKVLRGTDRQVAPGREAHMVVSAYAVGTRRVCKQTLVEKKGKEPAAAMQLIEQLSLKGCVVSADALHTRPKWCRAVRQRGGHYLLIVKGNRQELYEDIALLFEAGPFPDLPEQQAQTVDKQHGRLEVRTLRISSALTDFLKPGWPDVAQVFQIERRVTRGDKFSCECAYGFTSLTTHHATPHQVLDMIRSHWHIENVLHWRRDVTLGEDACQVSRGQTPAVLAALNNLVLFLIDHTGSRNAAETIRTFAAYPAKALALIMSPI